MNKKIDLRSTQTYWAQVQSMQGQGVEPDLVKIWKWPGYNKLACK